ncbi:MAG: hypothetical protein NC181_01060 [Clostridium sp.]|nr:hypothetical protein [Clostridium sp.]MCM1443752.1 hypothetical protein [Candidatus Amulumruptor caecigallinarius]
MKQLICKTFLIGLSVALVTGCGCEKKKEEDKNTPDTPTEDQVKVNTNEEAIKDQTLGVFTFKNTSITYINGTSTLITEVTNTSDKEQELAEFKISVKDKDGKEIEKLVGFVGGNMPANTTRTITSSTAIDLTDAVSIEYSIEK